MKYLAVTAFTIAILTGCQDPTSGSGALTYTAKAETRVLDHTPDPWYSPFVVELQSTDMVFSSISFKDVGTNLSERDREPIMETLAESIAVALEQDAAFHAEWNLRYDAELTTAAAHLSCGENHLYVDLWDTSGNWGYSLWSGCSEEDRFAIGTAKSGDKNDTSAQVKPLVDAVAEDLRAAHQSKCFVKTC